MDKECLNYMIFGVKVKESVSYTVITTALVLKV
jgi:hypothetical protein